MTVYYVYNKKREIVGQTPIKEQAVKAAMNYAKDGNMYGVSTSNLGTNISWYDCYTFVYTMWGD